MNVARNQDRDKEIFSRRLSGETYQSIADAYGISRQRIYQICKKELQNVVYELALFGNTASQICKKLGIPYDHECIRYYKRKGLL